MSSLQKLIAENAESAEILFKYCSAYSAVSAIKNPFCSGVKNKKQDADERG